MGARDEEAKAYREETRKVKRCIYKGKKKINEQFRKMMNEDMNGNGKLLWKEVSNVKGGKVESCRRIKYGNRRLTQDDEIQRIKRSILKICII